MEPDESGERMDVDRDSLADWFQYLANEAGPDDSENIVDNALREAQTFWVLSKGKPIAEKQDVDLGHCRLWIRTAEGLSSKVAFVRRTGMLVTTQQRGLIRFRGFRDLQHFVYSKTPPETNSCAGWRIPSTINLNLTGCQKMSGVVVGAHSNALLTGYGAR